ncbi:MAG: dehydrogenase, partial [Gammaproteobacteria bacterium]|nr:dehydrogenase [Gammaproteobacteria bacterium]
MGIYKSTLKHSVHFEELLDTLPSLTDKTIAITGTTSGTGFVAARTCGALGATVIMLNRPSERAKNVLERLIEENHPGSFHHVD